MKTKFISTILSAHIYDKTDGIQQSWNTQKPHNKNSSPFSGLPKVENFTPISICQTTSLFITNYSSMGQIVSSSWL